MTNLNLDTFSNDFLIHRNLNGFKLLDPYENRERIVQKQIPAISIAELLNMNCSIYFVDTQGIVRNSNQIHAECFGFNSVQSVLGISTFDLTEKTIAKNYLRNTSDAINTKQIKIIEENVRYKDEDNLYKCVSIKSPLFDEKDNVIGVLGCSIILDKHPIADVLTKVMQLGLLSHTLANTKLNLTETSQNSLFTSRENEILHYYVRGYTARGIATLLSISQRTVEQHIQNIKTKAGVRSKSELINVTFDQYKK